jgi:hypothetical protein
LTGWSPPEGLAIYKLEAKDAITLTSMRATYMIQLIVDLCGSTATSTAWTHLVEAMAQTDIQQQLVTLDSCCLMGMAEFCSLWTEALDMLTKHQRVDLKSVLLKAEVKPMTSNAIKLAGKSANNHGGSQPNPEDDGDNLPDNVLSVKELADFGSEAFVPSADKMLQLRWMLAAELIKLARTRPWLVDIYCLVIYCLVVMGHGITGFSFAFFNHLAHLFLVKTVMRW